MASSSPDPPKAPRDRGSAKTSPDSIILRNTLRYTISAKEYQTLHKYIISRSRVLKRNAPTVPQLEKLVARPGGEDYNAAAVRASLRLFFASSAALKAYTVISERFLGKDIVRYVRHFLDTMDAADFMQGKENPSMEITKSAALYFTVNHPPASSHLVPLLHASSRSSAYSRCATFPTAQ